MLRNFSLPITVIVAALALAPQAVAQTSKNQILQRLKPSGLTRSLVPTRKIEIIPGKEAEVIEQHQDLPKIDLTIEFEYDSDRPTPLGERQLVQLGEALRDPALTKYRFILAGHTDATGGYQYNQSLSERRAAAVQRYLIYSYGIDPKRLYTVGFGETRLLDDVYPDDPRNRRVEVVNVY